MKVRVVDAAGNTVPRSRAEFAFFLEGPGAIVATDNGDPTSFTPFQSTARQVFNGLALVVLKAKPGGRGRLVLRARGEGLPEARVEVRIGGGKGRP